MTEIIICHFGTYRGIWFKSLEDLNKFENHPEIQAIQKSEKPLEWIWASGLTVGFLSKEKWLQLSQAAENDQTSRRSRHGLA